MLSHWSWVYQSGQFNYRLSDPRPLEDGGVGQALGRIFAFLQTGLNTFPYAVSEVEVEESVSPEFLFPVDQALRQELSIYLSQHDWHRLRKFLGGLWQGLTDVSQCLKICSPQLESELKGVRSALAALQAFRALEELEVGDPHATEKLQHGLEEWNKSLVEMEQIISRLIGDQPRPWSCMVWLEADLALAGRDRIAGNCAEWSTWLHGLRRELVTTAAPLWNSRGPEVDLVQQLWLTLEQLHQALLELSHSDEMPLDLDAKLGEVSETLSHLAEIESATTEYFSLNWPEVPIHSPWADLLAAHTSSRFYSTSARWWKKLMDSLRPMLEWLIDEPRADLILDFDDDFREGLDVTELYQLAPGINRSRSEIRSLPQLQGESA